MILKTKIASNGKKIVCVTDTDLVGKKFSQGDKILDLTSEFYQGTETSEQEVIKEFNDAYIIVFTGNQAVLLGKKQHLLDDNQIVRIQNIPTAQCLLI